VNFLGEAECAAPCFWAKADRHRDRADRIPCRRARQMAPDRRVVPVVPRAQTDRRMRDALEVPMVRAGRMACPRVRRMDRMAPRVGAVVPKARRRVPAVKVPRDIGLDLPVDLARAHRAVLDFGPRVGRRVPIVGVRIARIVPKGVAESCEARLSSGSIS